MLDTGRAPELCQAIVLAQIAGENPEIPADFVTEAVVQVADEAVVLPDVPPEEGTLSPAEEALEMLPDNDLDSLLVWVPEVSVEAGRNEKVKALAAAGITPAQLGTVPQVVDDLPPPPVAEPDVAEVEAAVEAAAEPVVEVEPVAEAPVVVEEVAVEEVAPEAPAEAPVEAEPVAEEVPVAEEAVAAEVPVVEEVAAVEAVDVATLPVDALEDHGVAAASVTYLKNAGLATVADVEAYIAAHDGTLDGVEGIGDTREAQILAGLAALRG